MTLQIHSTPESAKVDLKVIICSRCARVIADGEERTEVSSSRLTSQTFGDFESASQVQAGSQPQFPQWEAGSTVSGKSGHCFVCSIKGGYLAAAVVCRF